jgi:hypothetical protein
VTAEPTTVNLLDLFGLDGQVPMFKPGALRADDLAA